MPGLNVPTRRWLTPGLVALAVLAIVVGIFVNKPSRQPAEGAQSAAGAPRATVIQAAPAAASVPPSVPPAKALPRLGSDSNCPASSAAASHRPTYLPAKAAATPKVDCVGESSALIYSLLGVENADTFPAGGASGKADGSEHPASVIVVNTVPANGSLLPDAPTADAYVSVTTVTLSPGVSARVIAPTSGYGVYRIDWVKNGLVHQLVASRGHTDHGDTGLPLSELLRMAVSID